jgi:hypothetical protein
MNHYWKKETNYNNFPSVQIMEPLKIVTSSHFHQSSRRIHWRKMRRRRNGIYIGMGLSFLISLILYCTVNSINSSKEPAERDELKRRTQHLRSVCNSNTDWRGGHYKYSYIGNLSSTTKLQMKRRTQPTISTTKHIIFFTAASSRRPRLLGSIGTTDGPENPIPFWDFQRSLLWKLHENTTESINWST